MEPEILQKIKDEYLIEKAKKAGLIKLTDEILELEKTETVKRYLELKDELASIKFQKSLMSSDDELLFYAFHNNCHCINSTNNIYVCLGTFMYGNDYDIVHGTTDIMVEKNDPKANYRVYINIEDGFTTQIAINNCPKFEKTHKVIFPNTKKTEKFYYDLQKEFISIMVEEGQEEACRKILTKTK